MSRFSKRKKLGTTTAFVLPLFISASVFAAQAPDAGRSLENLKGREIVLPEKEAPNVSVQEQQSTPGKQDEVRIMVRDLKITGQNVFKEEELLALVADSLGKELSLAEIEAVAGKITQHFRSNGYLVARAYIPAQEVKDGVVEIAVLVGRYDEIQLNNKSGVSDEMLSRMLNLSGDIVKAPLERRLLIVDDLPGTDVRATLTPGKEVGTSKIIIDVVKSDEKANSFSIDNFGNRYTGKMRFGATTNIENPGKLGDVLTVDGTYAGFGLDNIRLNYEMPAGYAGGRLGFSYSRMHYELGEEFKILDAYGSATIGSVYWKYPLIRSTDGNLYTILGYESRELRDVIGVVESADSAKTARAYVVGLSGDARDDHDGVYSYAVNCTLGNLRIENTADKMFDDLFAKTSGHYSKWNISAARRQYLSDNTAFYLFYSKQMASKNLDSSEKMSLGGAYGVRAYPQGEASGDEGYLLTGEVRFTMPGSSPEGYWQVAGFVDTGSVRINTDPWPGAGDNKRRLTGGGVGLIWGKNNDYTLRMDYAWKFGSEDAASDKDKNGRLWLQSVKYF